MSAFPKKIFKFFNHKQSKKPGDAEADEERVSESLPEPPLQQSSSRSGTPTGKSSRKQRSQSRDNDSDASTQPHTSQHAHTTSAHSSHHHTHHRALPHNPHKPLPTQDSDVGSEHDNRQPLPHCEELDSTKSFVFSSTYTHPSTLPHNDDTQAQLRVTENSDKDNGNNGNTNAHTNNNNNNDGNNNNNTNNNDSEEQNSALSYYHNAAGQKIDLDFDLNIPRVNDPDEEAQDSPRPASGRATGTKAVSFAKADSVTSAESYTASSHSHSLSSSSSYPHNFSLYETLNRSSSASMRDILAALDPEARKQYAIAKIQRQARKKNALKAAHAEQQWKMFADIDTQDEAEMLHLAVFMQTLLDAVPQASAIRTQTLQRTLSMDDAEVERSLQHGVSMEDLDACIRLDAIHVTPVNKRRSSLQGNSGSNHNNNNNTSGNDAEVDFSQREVDMNFVADIIDVFRNGQRLSKNTVMKVLRRVYKMLLKLPNTTHMSVPDKCTLTVVGDLHGQFADLLHILDECGLAGENNKFIFNGDFVDRGDQGLEIVCVLFAMMVAAGPQCVALNRGNHEDLPVCRVYGFEAEVKEKYDELLFEMFAEVFNHLPLFAVVEESVFVVHGGLFHNPQVSLAELEHINRADYFVKPPVPYPQNIQGMGPDEARLEYLKQLQRDALWSDPTEDRGCYLNPRGAGVTFGPDIAKQFMDRNGIDMVVRSHECCFRGFDLPFSASLRGGSMMINSRSFYNNGFQTQSVIEDCPVGDEPLLCTLFSASNYIGGDNEGAFLQFMRHPFSGSYPVQRESSVKKSLSERRKEKTSPPLFYGVRRYKTSEPTACIEDTNRNSLTDLIMRKKGALTRAFEACDPGATGFVTRVEWAETMQRVTFVKIRWLSIITTVAPPQALTPTMVDYRIFLQSFSLGDKLGDKSKGGKVLAMDDMYGKRKQLETVFYFFDKDGDGVISRNEFREGCELLNKSLHPDCQLTDIDRTLDVMDFDGSGSIDINEFFETFRILDAKDGKVDGVISLAKGPKKAR